MTVSGALAARPALLRLRELVAAYEHGDVPRTDLDYQAGYAASLLQRDGHVDEADGVREATATGDTDAMRAALQRALEAA